MRMPEGQELEPAAGAVARAPGAGPAARAGPPVRAAPPRAGPVELVTTLLRDLHVAWLEAHLGIVYDAGDDRLDPPESHPTDCSGWTWRGLHYGAGVPLPPVVSPSQAKWCYDAGGYISVGQALATKGAFVFMGPDRGLQGWGPVGHVATAVGDAVHVLETPSAGHKSGRSDARGRNWSGAGLWPGMMLDAAHQPPTPPVDWVALGKYLRALAVADLEPIHDNTYRRGASGPDVAKVQNAVNLAIGSALTLDGQYGNLTAGAVLWFQRTFFLAQPWEQDGVAGPHTLHGLQYELLLKNQS